jgi:acetyl esterase/lipase
MPTDHLIDPELKPALELIPKMDLSLEMVAPTRASFAQMLAAAPPPPEFPVTVEPVTFPGPAGAPPVRALLYRPRGATKALPAILHIHGGGYVFGSPELNDVGNRQLTAELGCVICSVDYRLAPETPHPGPLEDCYAALSWLHDQAKRLAIDPARIAVMGESAGGGLAAALALLARDRGGPAVIHQHLIYPMIDDRTCVHPDPHPFVGEFVWTHQNNVFGWTSLLGRAPGSVGISPYAAAARATDLSRLPPAFLSVGTLDLFLEEDLEYGRRLAREGVPVELHVYPGAFHGFGMAAQARTSVAAARDSREALRRALFG